MTVAYPWFEVESIQDPITGEWISAMVRPLPKRHPDSVNNVTVLPKDGPYSMKVIQGGRVIWPDPKTTHEDSGAVRDLEVAREWVRHYVDERRFELVNTDQMPHSPGTVVRVSGFGPDDFQKPWSQQVVEVALYLVLVCSAVVGIWGGLYLVNKLLMKWGL